MMAAGPAIAERALAAARAGQSPTLLEHYGKNGDVLQAQDVGAAAAEGDAVAIDVIRQSGRHIGEILAGLVNFFNPDMIVIGGGVSNLGDLLLSSIRQAVFGRSLPLATRNLQIVLSGIPPESAAIGAVNLALNYVFTTESPAAGGAKSVQRVRA
jgi:predicted NBD/HSP70 family sugar kinase